MDFADVQVGKSQRMAYSMTGTLFNVESHVRATKSGVLQVRAASRAVWPRSRLRPRSAAKESLEDIAEASEVVEAVETLRAVLTDTGVAEPVIVRAFLRVREDLIGLVYLFEFFYRAVGLVSVRVEFKGEFPERLLDLFIGGALGDTQDFVVISFLCGHPLPIIRASTYNYRFFHIELQGCFAQCIGLTVTQSRARILIAGRVNRKCDETFAGAKRAIRRRCRKEEGYAP